jgi:hypothetical protein
MPVRGSSWTSCTRGLSSVCSPSMVIAVLSWFLILHRSGAHAPCPRLPPIVEMSSGTEIVSTVVPNNTIFSCLNRYYEGSKCISPPVCAVCGQYREDATSMEVNFSSSSTECMRYICKSFPIDYHCGVLANSFIPNCVPGGWISKAALRCGHSSENRLNR